MSDVANTGAAAPAPSPAVTPAVTPAETPNEGDAEAAEGESPEANAAAAAEAKKIEDAKKALRKKYNLKVDGREEEVELDLDNDEEVKKHLQMSKAAQKRMQEAAEYKKNVNSFLEQLRSNPLQVLSDPRLGISDEQRKQLAEAIINNEIEELQKTPEQKEKEKLQKEYEALKKQHEEEKRQREENEFKRMQEQAAKQYDMEMSEAIKIANLPKTPRTVRYMAEALMFCLENGIDLSPKELAPMIRKQTLGEFKEMISSLPDEEFEDWLGKDQIGRIRKRNLAKIKAQVATPSDIKATGDSLKKEEKAPEKIAMKDFWKKVGKF